MHNYNYYIFKVLPTKNNVGFANSHIIIPYRRNIINNEDNYSRLSQFNLNYTYSINSEKYTSLYYISEINTIENIIIMVKLRIIRNNYNLCYEKYEKKRLTELINLD